MSNDDRFVSDYILETYYANAHTPTDEELCTLGIDPSQVFRIHNGPQTPLAEFEYQVERVVDQIITKEKKGDQDHAI